MAMPAAKSTQVVKNTSGENNRDRQSARRQTDKSGPGRDQSNSNCHNCKLLAGPDDAGAGQPTGSPVNAGDYAHWYPYQQLANEQHCHY